MTLWLEIGMFIVSVVGIAVACIQFGKQQKLDFFARYTERYQHIIEQLPEYVYTNQTLTAERYLVEEMTCDAITVKGYEDLYKFTIEFSSTNTTLLNGVLLEILTIDDIIYGNLKLTLE